LSFKISYTHIFFKSLDNLPIDLRKIFFKKIEKVKQEDISRKHLKYGLPYFVEKVTDSSRLIYKIEKNHLIFIICFQNHKDYEKWYRNLK
jgi:mRNA-degrading endonuclease RelE of RelBE toxin-antitoxin system